MGRKKSADSNECVVNSSGKRYRCTVQCLIFNDEGQFLSGVMTGPNNRNFRTPIQGGIDLGETDLLVTAQREMDEELGIDIKDLEFISVILPNPSIDGSFPFKDTQLENIKPLMNPPFDYSSSSFIGCVGQYIFPLLFRCVNPHLRINFYVEKNRTGFQTYSSAFWVDLSVLESAAPTSKRQVMTRICQATKCCLQSYYAIVGLAIPPRLPQRKLETYKIGESKEKLSTPPVVPSVLGAPPASSHSGTTELLSQASKMSVYSTPEHSYINSSNGVLDSDMGTFCPHRIPRWRGNNRRRNGGQSFFAYPQGDTSSPVSDYSDVPQAAYTGYYRGYHAQNRNHQRRGRYQDPHYQHQWNGYGMADSAE